MLQNAKVTTLTVSELLRENQHEGGIQIPSTQIRVKVNTKTQVLNNFIFVRYLSPISLEIPFIHCITKSYARNDVYKENQFM